MHIIKKEFNFWNDHGIMNTSGLEQSSWGFKLNLQKTRSIYDSMNRSTSFLDHLCYFSLVLLCFRARVFIDAMWSPAGKELTSWLTFVFYNCEVVTFPLVSWVRCGA